MSTAKLRELKTFAERLEYLRGTETKAAFSKKIGVSAPLYTQWIQGATPTFDKARLISERLEVPVDLLLTGHEPPNQLTPAMLPPDSAADPETARRLAAPSFTLTQRERVAQFAVAGYDAAQSKSKAAQFETLMQHVAGVAEGGQDLQAYQWHRTELGNIIEQHFPPSRLD